jgi:hypothetical protein
MPEKMGDFMKLLRTPLRAALRLCCTALAIAVLTDGADAQVTSAQQSAIRASCRSDFMSKCSGVTPGGKDALTCLQKNVGALSPDCRKAVSATLPPPAPAQKPAEAAPAAPPAAATASAPPPPAPSATAPAPAPVVSAPPPRAKTARPVDRQPKPAAVVTPPPAAPAPPPVAAAPKPEPAVVPGGAIITKACARYLVMHCANVGLNMTRKVACLVDYANSGQFVGPRCRAALKLTGKLR